MLLRCVTALAALFATTVSAYADPEPCTGECYARDPALIKRASDGAWFKFATNTGIDIYKAPNITGPWTYEGLVLPSGSVIDPSNTATWAPDVVQLGDQYVLYYALSQLDTQESSIGFAVSSTMENGTWVDGGWAGISSYPDISAYNAIDAAIIVCEDGTTQLNFGSYWGDIYQIPVEGITVVGSSTATQIAYWPSDGSNIEGSFMYYKDGYYYLFYSQGISGDFDTYIPPAGDEYKIYVCRSETYNGGFVDLAGTSCLDGGGLLVLESHGDYVYAPGGQGVYYDEEYGDILYYFYINPTIGLANTDDQFGWNVITWADGWPFILEEGYVSGL